MQKRLGQDTYPSVLAIHQLKVRVHLGVGKKEQAKAQDVEVDVKFYLPSLPTSAGNDKGEYICYDKLCRKIKTLCESKPYHLIEFLTHEIYRLLHSEVPLGVKLSIKLHKVKILLPYVTGGTSYSYTDLSPSAWVLPE